MSASESELCETLSVPLSHGRLFQVRFARPLTYEDVEIVEEALMLLLESMSEMARQDAGKSPR